MKNKKKDTNPEIDDTRVLPLEEIINMRRRIHDMDEVEEEIEEIEQPSFAGKQAFILDTSDATQLRREALEQKERKREEAVEQKDAKLEIPFEKSIEKEEEETRQDSSEEELEQSEDSKEERPKDEGKGIVAEKGKDSEIKEEAEAADIKGAVEEDTASLKKDALKKEASEEEVEGDEAKEPEEPKREPVETHKDDRFAEVVEKQEPAKEVDNQSETLANEKTTEDINEEHVTEAVDGKMEEEDASTMELSAVQEKDASDKQTYEDKHREELTQKQTLEEKRSIDLEKETLEEKRRKEMAHALTLEEKRKQQLENKLTLEEKRALRKQEGKQEKAKAVFSIKDYLHSLQALDIVSLLLFFVNVILDGYITWKISTYFSIGYAAIFCFVVLLILTGVFVAMVMKRKLGLIINVLMVILLGAGSVITMRFNTFVTAVFDNSESETIMIVAKKDSPLTPESDFKDTRLAMIKSDGDANAFAEEILGENKKSGYIKENYATYKEAYEALMDDKTELMVYTGLARQRLSEEEIDSWANVKVIYQKNRQLAAIEGTKVNILKDPFTVLISGVDLTSNTISEKGSSDVNILLVVNPNTKKIMMQTIPRDTWVPLACSNDEHTKLTYAGAYGGTDCSINTLEQYLDVEINYYAKINFNGVIELVDALGGITVNSDVSFCESHPLDGYGVRNYCYNAGENNLTGVEALMFSRIRKVFGNGDLERGNHQMEVINAVVRKFKEEPSLAHLDSLMNAVENNFATNLENDDLGKCLELFLSMSDQLSEIESYSMEGGTEWNTDEVTGEYLYYFYPNEGQLDLVKERINAVLAGK